MNVIPRIKKRGRARVSLSILFSLLIPYLRAYFVLQNPDPLLSRFLVVWEISWSFSFCNMEFWLRDIWRSFSSSSFRIIYWRSTSSLSFNFAAVSFKSLQRMHCFDSSSLICVRQFLSLNLAALYLESRLRFFNWSCVNSSSSVSRWKFSAWDDVIVSVSLTVSTVDGGRLFSQNTLLPGKQVNFSDLAHFMTHFIWHYIIKGVT